MTDSNKFYYPALDPLVFLNKKARIPIPLKTLNNDDSALLWSQKNSSYISK